MGLKIGTIPKVNLLAVKLVGILVKNHIKKFRSHYDSVRQHTIKNAKLALFVTQRIQRTLR